MLLMSLMCIILNIKSVQVLVSNTSKLPHKELPKLSTFFVNITKNDLSWWWCPFPSLNGVQGRHVYCLYFMHTHSCSHYLMCSKQILHKISHVEGCYRVQLLSHEDGLYTGTDRGTGTLSENITLEQK